MPLGVARGGRTTKIHALNDDPGRPVAFTLTQGNAHKLTGTKALLTIRCPDRKLLADRSYDAASLRGWCATRGTGPVGILWLAVMSWRAGEGQSKPLDMQSVA